MGREISVMRKIEIVQGPNHKRDVINHMKNIISACYEEFTEDNRATLEGFLEDCFEVAKEESFKEYMEK